MTAPWLSVIVATFGSNEWRNAGEEAAATIPSGATPIVVHLPYGNLALARNTGLSKVTTPYVTWLDADDALTPDYVDAMATGTADLRQPAVDGWTGSVVQAPRCGMHGPQHIPERECLAYGNPFSMGAVVRTELAKAHPFDPRWPVLEDFAFWRAICANPWVSVEVIEAAIYRVRRIPNPAPRNRSLPRPEWKAVADAIRDAVPFP